MIHASSIDSCLDRVMGNVGLGALFVVVSCTVVYTLGVLVGAMVVHLLRGRSGSPEEPSR